VLHVIKPQASEGHIDGVLIDAVKPIAAMVAILRVDPWPGWEQALAAAGEDLDLFQALVDLRARGMLMPAFWALQRGRRAVSAYVWARSTPRVPRG
jgi:hypothetical protein